MFFNTKYLFLPRKTGDMELKIDKILADKGMRMADLASKLDVDQSNLTKSLLNNPKLSRLKEVAEALDVSVQDLFPDTTPSIKEGVLRVGSRHFALVPVDIPEKPFHFNSGNFFAEIEAFVLRCIKYTKTVSFSGVYNENYPFALIYDAQSRRLFVSFAPAAKDYNTFVYELQKDSIVQQYVTDESVANYIARNIVNDIEEMI